MMSDRPLSHPSLAFASAAERRAAAEFEEQERIALRQKELESQASPLNDPRERIRIWEQLHALALPKHSGHKLVPVIAMQTRLSVDQVQEEQQRRAEPTPAP